MTAEEVLKFRENPSGNLYNWDELQAVITDALKKQVPMKPKGDYHSVPHYRCPNCNRAVKVYDDDRVFDYCTWCGQKILWED